MPHIRMVAPPHHLSVSVDGIVYQIGADGEFDAHQAHQKALEAQGYKQKTHRQTIELTAEETAFLKDRVREAVAPAPVTPLVRSGDLQENADQAPPALEDAPVSQEAADEPF